MPTAGVASDQRSVTNPSTSWEQRLSIFGAPEASKLVTESAKLCPINWANDKVDHMSSLQAPSPKDIWYWTGFAN